MTERMASRITRILLLTLFGALLVSVAVIPTTAFALVGTGCKTTSTPAKNISSDYIQVEIPIPGLTVQVVCTDGSGAALAPVYAVEDLGAYLGGVYQYFVSIVGILAVVMIMYAGIRWILAAGNQSSIQGAKNIMMSAIIGVVIAFCSYLLLYLLNPATVDMSRLSSTFSSLNINLTNVEIQGFTCSQLPATTPVQVETSGLACRSDIRACDDQTKVTVAGNVGCGSLAKVTSDPNAKLEGQAKAGQACVGDKCNNNGKCIDDQCIVGFLAGMINWTENAYVDNMWIDGLCADAKVVTGQNNNINEGTHFYRYAENFRATTPDGRGGTSDMIADFGNISNTCSSHGGLAGYLLRIEVNDDQGAAFNLLSTTDDQFYVDRDCKVIDGQSGEKDPSKFAVASLQSLVNSGRLFTVKDFFYGTLPPAEYHFIQTPYLCNISISRQDFPAR